MMHIPRRRGHWPHALSEPLPGPHARHDRAPAARTPRTRDRVGRIDLVDRLRHSLGHARAQLASAEPGSANARPAPVDDLLHTCEKAGRCDAYVVLDGCAATDLPQRLRAAGAEYWCLLSDGLGPVLSACAPYLVQLRPEAAAVVDLLRSVWGRRCGIALCAPAGSDGWLLREHLRGWLRITDARGHVRLFRFYDPHALRAMLPDMTSERRDAFLAPLGRLYVEGGPRLGLLEFCRGGPPEGRLAQR